MHGRPLQRDARHADGEPRGPHFGQRSSRKKSFCEIEFRLDAVWRDSTSIGAVCEVSLGVDICWMVALGSSPPLENPNGVVVELDSDGRSQAGSDVESSPWEGRAGRIGSTADEALAEDQVPSK